MARISYSSRALSNLERISDFLSDEGVELLHELALRCCERGNFRALVVLVSTKTLHSTNQGFESSIGID